MVLREWRGPGPRRHPPSSAGPEVGGRSVSGAVRGPAAIRHRRRRWRQGGRSVSVAVRGPAATRHCRRGRRWGGLSVIGPWRAAARASVSSSVLSSQRCHHQRDAVSPGSPSRQYRESVFIATLLVRRCCCAVGRAQKVMLWVLESLNRPALHAIVLQSSCWCLSRRHVALQQCLQFQTAQSASLHVR